MSCTAKFGNAGQVKARKIKNKGDVRARYLIVGKVYGKYVLAIITPTLRIETTCPQEAKKTDIANIGFRDLIIIRRTKVSLESINKKVRLLFESINMRKIKKVYRLKLKTIKEFNAKDEDELLEQVMLWPKVDKEWDKGWKRIEPKKNIKDQ